VISFKPEHNVLSIDLGRMKPFAKIVLKPGKESSLRRFHLWVFSGAVQTVEGDPGDGDWVGIYSSSHQFLALGHFCTGSIRARIVDFARREPGPGLWKEKLSCALAWRERLGLFRSATTDAFRLVNAEGDGLPGLTVDHYNGIVVIQAQTLGMFRSREEICWGLRELLGDRLRAVYVRGLAGADREENEPATGEFLFGSSGPVEILEHGHRFEVDFVEGQKTGFFLDQRENRRLLGGHCEGRDVLDLFAYTGGFSVYAAKAGAKSVVSVDVSGKALERARYNLSLNGLDSPSYRVEREDAFRYLDRADESFDVVVLDPPAFAKHHPVVRQALNGYRSINGKALARTRKGGLVFTFSCSQRVTRDAFQRAVFTAAAQARRSVRLLGHLSQPVDHPVNIYHPEGEYLKGLVLAVD
jgi:23S rRNA (cytosine1962-C5)-methyltransferase